MDHVSVSADGRLVLSPDYRRLAELDEPVTWAAAFRGDDVLVGTGHDGRVLRVPGGGGKPAIALDAGELEVHALAVADDGTLFAGTSPEGKVYRIAPGGGDPQVVFDPEERYVWALLLAPDGGLYVATGDKGAVYRVPAGGGAPTPVLTVDETHVLALALAPDGTLYAGSGGNGYIYRVAPGGATTVLVDTAGSEVKALALAPDGTLFAASTGRPSAMPEATVATDFGVAAVTTVMDEPPPGSFETAGALLPAPSVGLAPSVGPAPSEGPAPSGPSSPGPAQQPQPTPTPAPAAPPAQVQPPPQTLPPPTVSSGPRQSWLYRVRKDGLPEEIWRSAQETVHALALLEGALVLGTGDEGRVLEVDPETGEGSIWLDFPGAQVTALAPRAGGLAVVTSNLGSVWRVEGHRPAPQGTYVSPVVDAGHFATWGRLSFDAPPEVRAATRSGNTEKPGAHWSEWADAPGGEVKSPRARYLQFRLTLSARSGPGPEVKDVEVAFLPWNLQPRLRSLVVLDPHVELVSSAAGAGLLGAAPGGGRGLPPRRRPEGGETRETPSAPREQESYGMRSARWEAEDPNGDALEFTVSYRGEEEEEWKLLAEELEEPFVAFEASALPDGRYRLRVEASDVRSNPESHALTAELVGERFTIDGTPPRVAVAASAGADGEVTARVQVSDATSLVHWAEFSVDAGAWRAVHPEDLVFDEREERVVLTLPAGELEPGEHTIVVRAEDAARNVGAGKAVVRVR